VQQERERNTPDAWWQASADAAAAAANDPRGKAPMLPHPASSRRDRYSGLCSTAAPPVLLPKLTQLSIAHCCGVLPAIVGCFAHSTGLNSLELAFGYEPPPVSLAAIAWMWPRITDAKLSDHHNPGCSRRLVEEEDSGSKGLSSSSSRHSLSQATGNASSSQAAAAVAAAAPRTLPNLLDERVTPGLAAAWLWGSSSNKFRSSNLSSSSSGSGGGGACSSSNATSMRLMEEVSRRAAAGRVFWADASGLAQLAAALPNLSKLSLHLPHRFNRDAVLRTSLPLVAASQAAGGSSSSRVHSSSSSSSIVSKPSFGPVDLLVLSAAPRLRELVVELPAQLSTFDAAAAGVRQLTALHRLRLLDLKCSLESPITAVVRNLWVRQRAQPAAAGGGGPAGDAVGADAPSDDDADDYIQPAAVAGNLQLAAPAQPALPGFGLPPMPPPLGGPLAGLGAHGRGGLLHGGAGAGQAGRGFGNRFRGGWAGGRGAAAGGLGLDGPMWRGLLAARDAAAADVARATQAAAAGGSGAAAAGGGAVPQAQQQQDAEAGDGRAQGAAMTGAVGSLAQGVEQLMAASNDGAGAAGPTARNAAAAAAAAAAGDDADGDHSIWRSRAPRRITPTAVGRRDELAAFEQQLSSDFLDVAADEELTATMAAAAAAAAAGAAQQGEAGHHEAAAEPAQQVAAARGQPEAAASQPVAAGAEARAAQPQQALQPAPAALLPIGVQPAAGGAQGGAAAAGGNGQAGGAAAAAAAAAVAGVLAAAAGNAQAGGAAAAAAPAAEGGPAPEDLLSMYIDDDFWEEESNTDAADADTFMRDIHEAWGGGPEEPGGAAGGEDEPQPADVQLAAGEGQAAGADGAPAPVAPAAAAAAAAGGGAQGGAGGAAAAAGGGGGGGGGGAAKRKRRYKPAGLQAQMRHDMPTTSVFLRILRG